MPPGGPGLSPQAPPRPLIAGRIVPMDRTYVRVAAGLLLAAATLLVGSAGARAGDFDGKWTMNANGWTFILKIEQKDDRITGTMRGLNNDGKSKIEGKIRGHEITFIREGSGQEYRGYLFIDPPPGKDSKNAMAGTARGGKARWGWYATR
jgi:hypothetical protein